MYSAPQATWTVVRLIRMQVALAVAILLELVLWQRHTLRDTFALNWHAFFHRGYFWQLVTASLVHISPLELLFNLLTLWMFGSELEQRWGRRTFLRYYLFCAVFSAAMFLLLAAFFPAMRHENFFSSAGANLGLLFAYAVYWPERQAWFFFLFPVRMKFVVLITGLLVLAYAVLSAPFVLSAAGHLGGLVGGGLLLLFTGGEPARAGQIFSGWAETLRQRWGKRKNPLASMSPRELEARVDAILDKISRGGMKSLSAEEKKFLRQASEHFNKTKN
ncbi:MAG: rhomboid family intramembrane serine protease [Turneriella sp.]|nr:rhomboid family intramembrane serine protease [Turneriella sp.]